MLRGVVLIVLWLLAGAGPAFAVELLQNGSFESPDGPNGATGWELATRYDFIGSPSAPPVFSGPTPEWTFGAAPRNPTGVEQFASDGASYGVFFPDAPGDYALSQSFTVPTSATGVYASIDILLFGFSGEESFGGCGFYDALANVDGCAGWSVDSIGNVSGVRVDILHGTAAQLAGDDAVIAQIVAQQIVPIVQDPMAYTTFTADLTGLVAPGETYRFRVALALFNGRVLIFDRASVVAVPEPGAWVALLGLAALVALRRTPAAI